MTDHSAHLAAGIARPDPAKSNQFQVDMNKGMARMMDDMHRPAFTGNPDHDFLAMMIPHHEGAIDMARLLLIHGRDPLVRQLAEDIIASQTIEVAGMRGRMTILLEGANPQPGGFPALGSVRGE